MLTLLFADNVGTSTSILLRAETIFKYIMDDTLITHGNTYISILCSICIGSIYFTN